MGWVMFENNPDNASVIRMKGGIPLYGSVQIQGSKNIALPIIAASILVNGKCTLSGCPDITDVDSMFRLIESAGAIVCKNENQIYVENFYSYEMTFYEIKDIAFASLYTAICPPNFTDRSYDKIKKLKWYLSYLLWLQDEYKEMIEFCYDEDFYPEILGSLYPSERLKLYRTIHDLPFRFDRTEELSISNRMGGKEMPYGMPINEILDRIKAMSGEPTEAEKQFAEKYNISVGTLKSCIAYPSFMSIKYSFRSVADILELEFTKMLEQNVHFRKCKRCGKYFIMKGKYDTRYCDRVAEGESRSCQEFAAAENYKAKHADDKATAIYSKYYKRYSARVKVRQIKEADFKKWKYQAMTKRDECTAGNISAEEFAEWMEEIGVYWAYVFGNHEAREEKSYYKYLIFKSVSDYPHCLSKFGNPDLFGFGNFIINIMNSETELKHSLFFFDSGRDVIESHALNDNVPLEYVNSYDYIKPSQIRWYENELKSLRNTYGEVKNTLYMHIPIPEYKQIFKLDENGDYLRDENGELVRRVGLLADRLEKFKKEEEEIKSAVNFCEIEAERVVSYVITTKSEDIFVVYNASDREYVATLPDSRDWDVLVDENKSGNECIKKVNNQTKIPAVSCLVAIAKN